MALSAGDILRWSPDAVLDLSKAAAARSTATAHVATALRQMPVFGDWQGVAADSALTTSHQLAADLDSHADEAAGVQRAAGRAAEHVVKVQSDLRRLIWDIEDQRMHLDPVSSTIGPGPGFRGNALEFATKAAAFESRLASIQAEAQLLDEELAQAIQGAGSQRQSTARGVDYRTFKDGPPLPDPGMPDQPSGNGRGPTGADISGVTNGLPSGTKPNIKLVQTQQQLEDLYKWAAENGTPIPDPYGPNPGTAYQLPDGTRVGMRQSAGSTKLPALDINYPDKGWEKIHINPAEGAAPAIPRVGGSPTAGEAPKVAVNPAPEVAVEPPVANAPRGGPMPIGGGPVAPGMPTFVPPPHSINHPPVFGKDDTEAPWEYEE